MDLVTTGFMFGIGFAAFFLGVLVAVIIILKLFEWITGI